MLFKKNPQPNLTPLPQPSQQMTDEQELAALESQLDFLRKPAPGPKLKTPEMLAKEKEEAKAKELHVVPGNAIPVPDAVNQLDNRSNAEKEEQKPLQELPVNSVTPVPSKAQIPQPQGTLPTVPPQGGVQPNPFLQQQKAAPQQLPGKNPFLQEQAPKNPVQPPVQNPYLQDAAAAGQGNNGAREPQPASGQTAAAPQAYAIQNINVNPVAPAIVPPSGVMNPAAAALNEQARPRENTPAPAQEKQPQVLTPRPLQEVAAESAAAALGKTVQPENAIPRTQNGWGRPVNYKTAVIKSGGQSNSIGTGGHHEVKEIPKQIRNPLPTPKKHVAKEMEFDVTPDGTMMHFDLVDMNGIDHFDIN